MDAVWAGHPAGLLLTERGAERVDGDGIPVGMFPAAELTTVHFEVRPGQTLVLYTDGLAERDAAVLEDAELTSLFTTHRHLPAYQMLQAVTADIDARHGRRDDVAAIAVRLLATS